MKKILILNGSPNDGKSNTMSMIRDFIDLLKEEINDIRYETITLGNMNLSYCKGCWSCTKKGECIINDDLDKIKKKIFECNLLIISSPVYVHQVPAQLKIFFDRLFIWLHTVRLIGKPVLTAVTTGGSGMKAVEKYLDLVINCLGGIIQGRLRGIAYSPGVFPDREKCKLKHKKLAAKITDILNGKKQLKGKLKNSFYFWGIKSKAKFGKDYLKYENKYWNEKGWFKLSYNKAMRKELELNKE